MRIELLETKDGTFFDTGSARLNQHGEELLEMLAGQLGQVPNRISIEGHTDAQPYASQDGYGNWELSSDRANAARRVMETTGLRKGQVSQVRGYADQKLRVPDNPMDPSNRRISLIVQYLTADEPGVPVSAGTGPPGEKTETAGSSAPAAEKASAEKARETTGGAAAGNAPGAAPGAVQKTAAVAKPSFVARLMAKLHKK